MPIPDGDPFEANQPPLNVDQVNDLNYVKEIYSSPWQAIENTESKYGGSRDLDEARKLLKWSCMLVVRAIVRNEGHSDDA
jgi:hypothetical protein